MQEDPASLVANQRATARFMYPECQDVGLLKESLHCPAAACTAAGKPGLQSNSSVRSNSKRETALLNVLLA